MVSTPPSVWGQAFPVTVALDGYLVAGVGQSIQSAVPQYGVIEESQPLIYRPVAGDNEAGAAVSGDDELVEVGGLLSAQALQANDGQSDSNVAVVTITINPVNDPPTAVDDSYIVDEDTALTVPASGVLGNDTDADSTTLTAVVVSGPSHGTLTLNADGSFSYTSDRGYSGADSFTYRVSDGQVDSGLATVTIDVIPSENTPSGGGWVRAVVPWLAAAVALFVLILVLVARRRRKNVDRQR